MTTEDTNQTEELLSGKHAINDNPHTQGTAKVDAAIKAALADDLTFLPNNIYTNEMSQENGFHSPAKQEVHKHLTDNTSRIFLNQLQQKEVYTKYSICVDGREDGEGIASFGGFAGILGATVPALKEIYGDKINVFDILKGWLGETKFYVHCDDHTQHDTHGASYCNCQKIGCGAINLMLKPENGAQYGYSDEDRKSFWNMIDSHGQVKVLKGEHEEQGIIIIDNQVRKDKDSGEEYIDHPAKNMKDGTQYFVSHNTGRNRIISYFASDLAEYIANTQNIEPKEGMDKNDMALELKEVIMKWSDVHAGATLNLLGAAQKVLKEKGDDAIITVGKISHKGKHILN